MNSFNQKVILPAILVLLLINCPNSFSTTINISAINNTFSPSPVNAQVGDTIQWNRINGTHTTTCDGSSLTSRPSGAAPWNSSLNSSFPTYRYVLTVAGTYNYKCAIHAPSMVGVINASSPPLALNLTSIIEGLWNGTSMVSDTVKVYLHSSTTPFAKLDSAVVMLNSSGNGLLSFTHAPGGQYYIVVTHRNSLETWSKLPQTFTAGQTTTYNFTTAANQAFGDNLKFKINKFTNYSGDVNQDGNVDVSDVIEVYNALNNFKSGYVKTDVNGDDFVDSADLIITYNNSIFFVSVIRP